MEFLLKKISDPNAKNSIELKELKELLEFNIMKKQIAYAKAVADEVSKAPKFDKKTVKELIQDDFVSKGEVLNISAASSIENDETIPVGSIYYDNKSDSVRIKKKTGWASLKTE